MRFGYLLHIGLAMIHVTYAAHTLKSMKVNVESDHTRRRLAHRLTVEWLVICI